MAPKTALAPAGSLLFVNIPPIVIKALFKPLKNDVAVGNILDSIKKGLVMEFSKKAFLFPESFCL